MRALIDAHTLVWAGDDPSRLSPSASIVLQDPTSGFGPGGRLAGALADLVRWGATHRTGGATKMDVTISLSPAEAKTLLERASASGNDVAGYIHHLIEQHVRGSGDLSELLAPVRREFAESGMSEDDLDSLVEEAREEVWRAKQLGPSDLP